MQLESQFYGLQDKQQTEPATYSIKVIVNFDAKETQAVWDASGLGDLLSTVKQRVSSELDEDKGGNSGNYKGISGGPSYDFEAARRRP